MCIRDSAHALQAGQTVAQEGQLSLQLAFVGHGTAAEDLEDEHGAVDDLEACLLYTSRCV